MSPSLKIYSTNNDGFSLESEADNQKLENKYEQAERRLQQAMDDRDRAQSEHISAINGKAQSEQDWHRVLMPLKENFCTEWERGQEARFERLRNSIMEDFHKQLADHQKTITDHQKAITNLEKTITDHQKEITVRGELAITVISVGISIYRVLEGIITFSSLTGFTRCEEYSEEYRLHSK
ncbi:hypothetical protein L211DRAFT_58838 [Terfezia boudieri ATCC MYA-4762]|uniref:Uncharacterized protein n=1 Tax=Terfezia boudieri ATCC MYA-4762 TaxID=1051890 RepID=A0A3N4M6X7_9PEZI|nr:hypothetical protein L211DRAFT_58838 [Terfezia boudieri ATCC MYA-4762]